MVEPGEILTALELREAAGAVRPKANANASASHRQPPPPPADAFYRQPIYFAANPRRASRPVLPPPSSFKAVPYMYLAGQEKGTAFSVVARADSSTPRLQRTHLAAARLCSAVKRRHAGGQG